MKYKEYYVGQKSKSRTRKKYLFFIIFIVIIFFLYISIREKNLTETSDPIKKIEKDLVYEDQSLRLRELETKNFEYDQKLQLRNQLIESLKDQKKDLEKNNKELLKSIELQSIKKDELNNFQKTIQTLKKEAKKQNNNFLLFEKKNEELNDQIQILNDTNDKLILEKNEISEKIINLQYNIIEKENEIIEKENEIIEKENEIIEKEKIIENLKDKIHP